MGTQHSVRTACARGVAGLLALTTILTGGRSMAAPADTFSSPAPVLGSNPQKAADLRDGEASVSTQTGALTYSYPITVPPGRGADLVRTVTELRAQPGGYIYLYGSPTLVGALLAADLVDELLLTIEPIVLGGGKTLFPTNGEAIPFKLLSSKQAKTGAQVCHYERDRSRAQGARRFT